MHSDVPTVLEQLKFDHIEGYDYDLKADLEAIVNGKLNRHRTGKPRKRDKELKVLGTPVEQVVKSVQGILDFTESEAYENVNDLLRDTANYYHQKVWQDKWDKMKRGEK